MARDSATSKRAASSGDWPATVASVRSVDTS